MILFNPILELAIEHRHREFKEDETASASLWLYNTSERCPGNVFGDQKSTNG